MSHKSEIDALEHELRDLDYKLAGFKSGIAAVDKEIVLISMKELALKDNIKNLRKNSFIVLASEFKRSKEDLVRTSIHLESVKKHKGELEKGYAQVQDYQMRARVKYNDLKRDEVSNVLPFERKNGQ